VQKLMRVLVRYLSLRGFNAKKGCNPAASNALRIGLQTVLTPLHPKLVRESSPAAILRGPIVNVLFCLAGCAARQLDRKI
jgi:hypothetical protein